MRNVLREGIALAVFIAVCFTAAGIGGIFTARSVQDWYAYLRRPAWAPPAWLFGPVWTALYLSMALAAWLIWRGRGFSGARGALVLFAVQLVLNAAWSPLFFGLRSPAAAFADIVALWVAIAATTVAFYRLSLPAGVLMTPYWLWVTFAAGLNLAIWRMNA